LFVEHRPQGDYAVRKTGSERASAVLPTQADAIERARELVSPSSQIVIESTSIKLRKALKRLADR
jgi:hypothetical protein